MKGFWTFSIGSILFFVVAFSLVAFNDECKHIYVAVEQPEVSGETGAVLSLGRFGKHEGRDIVCVKCLHLRKQIVNYGEGGQLRVLPSWLKGDTALIKRLLIVLD